MKPLFLSLLLLSVGSAAQAQPADPHQVTLARASICSPAGMASVPDFDAVAGRAAEWGWAELPRKDALRLQAIPDKAAVVRAWMVGTAERPAYLLLQTTPTPKPRSLACETLFDEPDSAAIQALLSAPGSGEALGAPTLEGRLPQGGRFVEWNAPADSGWKRVTYSIPLPAKKGPTLSRIRYSGVER